MKVGSIVECIKPCRRDYNTEVLPIVGEVYTVRALETVSGALGVYLEEIVNPPLAYLEGVTECLFAARNFRELLPPADISEIYKDALTIPERGLILVKETINTPNL